MTRLRRALPVIAVLVALLGAGCSRGPLKVTAIQLGRALNSDRSIATHVTRFKPDEAVYVAVLTDGPGSGDIMARWTFGGHVISEETKNVSYTQGAATEFHITYAGGFPPGAYKFEILIDGKSIEARAFRIEP
jgi:hypothetical protein